MVVVTSQGAQWFGNLMLGINVYAQMRIRLFTNLHLPTCEDTLLNYTELVWNGYSGLILSPNTWNLDAVGSCASEYSYPLLTWVLQPGGGAPQTVFGYYVSNLTGLVLWAEAFAAPFPIPPEGGNIPINLFFSDKDCGV